MRTTFTFHVDKIVFQKDSFSIIKTETGDSVSGNFEAKIGYSYKGFGTWDNNSPSAMRYGPTFKAETVTQLDMTASGALCKYLTHSYAGTGKGVGKVFLEKLAATCIKNDKCLSSLLDAKDEATLKELAGSRNRRKVDTLLADWEELKPQSDLKTPLLNLALSDAQAQEVLELWGSNAVERIRRKPYDLIFIVDGISFARADQIAHRVGYVPADQPERVNAAFFTALRDFTSQGSIGVPRSDLLKAVRLMVNDTITVNNQKQVDTSLPLRVSDERLVESLRALIKNTNSKDPLGQSLTDAKSEAGDNLVWLTSLLNAEDRIVNKMVKLDAPSLDDLIPKFEAHLKASDVTLSQEQTDAVKMVLQSPVSIITGGPGCGKSFVLKQIIETLDKGGLRGELAAPTGKAAKRMIEATGRHAVTLHSLLGMKSGGQMEFNDANPITADYIIVDEASMVDVRLLRSLMDAVSTKTRLVFVGDIDQLPPVGPGQPLRDLIRSETIPTTRLLRVWRFSGGIAEAAQALNAGKIPETSEDKQFEFIHSPDASASLLEYLSGLLKDGESMEDIQVIAPTNRGRAGCSGLNADIQKMVNEISHHPRRDQTIEHPSGLMFVGDKVMQVKNNYELGIVNGDIGWIYGIAPKTGEVEFALPDKDEPVFIERKLAKDLRLAYAITIHKSQGAEAPIVLVAADRSATFMLTRNLLYTAITRGARKVVLFSTPSLVASAAKKGEPKEGTRNTLLNTKLRNAFSLKQEVESIAEEVSRELSLAS